MEGMRWGIALIPLLPLLSFMLLGLWGRRYFRNFSGMFATIVLGIITILSLVTAYYYFVDGKINGVYQTVIPVQYTWLQFRPGMSIDMGIMIDPISIMMLAVVSFISLMVHIFSLGYMKGEERFATYYAFLSLFTFSMLGLVISTNIFQVYIFWELVGISSYLLIGFYFEKPSAVAASKKAFIVTRFADLGFLIGILILAFHAGTLNFRELITRLTTEQSPELLSITTSSFLGVSMLTWGLLLVFTGGAGKSAMFPLHIWLPDAMEGPTPVSALIHAATMVVAGVYLVARLFPLYSFDVIALDIVAYIGVLSSLLAAIIACTQTDIKRVLAYSTMSQIGYMMFALGVSGYGGENGTGYSASMFHLFTHAFFKSLLFLCAGAVIHFVHSNEMNDMGGLKKRMPLTHLTFLIACLAISGIPPFAGFFSKEEILLAAYHADKFIYGIGLFTSMLTAFYMFRLYFCVFWATPPSPSEIPTAPIAIGGRAKDTEAPFSMKFPLLILAVCTLFAGLVPFSSYITSDGSPFESHLNIAFSALPVALSVIAILFAARLYKRRNDLPGQIAGVLGGLYHIARRKFFIDELYLFVTKKIMFNLVGRPAAWIDRNIVDGLMNLLASATAKISEGIKKFQSGKVQDYTLYFFAGAGGLAVLFLYVWKGG